ncbi:hypothetical protein [Arcobacter sp. LA11]|uniref:hypothetical protein n=1 Tax=Arcobacter sp. LA11 TaxID=1898176 RepID=UPI000934A362|nr:hypothetical protein [Arcobacter sp. LA11]
MTEQETLEMIKLFDTTIKIGLGSIIGGAFTYYTVNLNHKNKLKEERISKKTTKQIEMLEEIALRSEDHFSLIENFIRKIYSITSVNEGKYFSELSESKKEEIRGFYKEYKDAIKNEFAIVSKLNILNMDNANKIFKELIRKVVDYRNDILSSPRENIKLTKETIKNRNKEIRKLRDSFHLELQGFFDKI